MSGFPLLRYTSAFSIGLAVLIGLVKFKHIDKLYRPFIFFCIVALVNEVISICLVKMTGSNTINNNVYVLLEMIIILYLLRGWGTSENAPVKYNTILGVLASRWVADNVIVHSLKSYTSIYHICYYLTFIFLSIEEMNFVVVNEKEKLTTNAKFIICSCFLLYFSLNVFLEIFFVLHVELTPGLTRSVLNILRIINLLINLIYAIAAICIPTKQKYTLQS